jgi:nucleoside phosphorylase
MTTLASRIQSFVGFRRLLIALAVLAAGLAGAPAQGAPEPPCQTRTLVLSAYPGEADAVLARMTLDEEPARVVDGHHFYLGTMGGKAVVSTMTGIGLTNAANTTRKALTGFTCANGGIRIGAVLFSGVAGGAERTKVGDVAIPARWTLDDGATWRSVDPALLAAARGLTAPLMRVNTAGDPACLCTDPNLIPLVDMGREMAIYTDGDGYSSDALNGEASPCIPGGGDVFGCEPCTAPDRVVDPTGTVPGAIDWFLANVEGGYPAGSTKVYDAVDQETAAVQVVADEHKVPFLGFRGMSDGPGDPLNLPGFPFQFFFYRQLAANNAAIAVEAYLEVWHGPAGPPAEVLGATVTAPAPAPAAVPSSTGPVTRSIAPPAAPVGALAAPQGEEVHQPSVVVPPPVLQTRPASSDDGIPAALGAFAVLLVAAAAAGTGLTVRRAT